MATKMKRLSLHLRTILLLIWCSARGGDGYSCPYGQSCAFEPAPRGHAPACAQPGLTYCLHPDPYPEKIIRSLIETGQYDIRTLLSDESRDDFTATKKTEYPYDYGPNSLPHVDQISLVNDNLYPTKTYNTKFHTRYNHDIFTQKTPLQPPSPVDPSPYNVNYQSANFSKFGFQGYNYPGPNWQPNQYGNEYDKRGGIGYNNNFFEPPPLYPGYENEWLRQATAGVTPYNPSEWWKYVSPSRSDVTVERSVSYPTRTSTARRRRNAELVQASAKRTLTGAEALRIALGLASAETSAERPRRQPAAAGTEELCSVRTEYITPRAALNNKGSWKYVVNMPDNMTQLVRAEICTSTTCNGICSVPPGYTSRCEQKYIQKRLVALQPTGQKLYTDIFGFLAAANASLYEMTTK